METSAGQSDRRAENGNGEIAGVSSGSSVPCIAAHGRIHPGHKDELIDFDNIGMDVTDNFLLPKNVFFCITRTCC